MSCGIFNIAVECLNKKFFLSSAVRSNGSFRVLHSNQSSNIFKTKGVSFCQYYKSITASSFQRLK